MVVGGGKFRRLREAYDDPTCRSATTEAALSISCLCCSSETAMPCAAPMDTRRALRLADAAPRRCIRSDSHLEAGRTIGDRGYKAARRAERAFFSLSWHHEPFGLDLQLRSPPAALRPQPDRSWSPRQDLALPRGGVGKLRG